MPGDTKQVKKIVIALKHLIFSSAKRRLFINVSMHFKFLKSGKITTFRASVVKTCAVYFKCILQCVEQET